MLRPEAVEYQAPDKRMVAWFVTHGRNGYPKLAVAIRAPWGWWYVTGPYVSGDCRSLWDRYEHTLRRARMMAIGGNGKLYGRHTTITAVRPMSKVHILALITAVKRP